MSQQGNYPITSEAEDKIYVHAPRRTVRSADSYAAASQSELTWYIEIACVISFTSHFRWQGQPGAESHYKWWNFQIHIRLKNSLFDKVSLTHLYNPFSLPPSLCLSLFLFHSEQGDAGETGEPGPQGELGPPVSYWIRKIHLIIDNKSYRKGNH